MRQVSFTLLMKCSCDTRC